MYQQTISQVVSISGIGTHGGEMATVSLRPAPENTGIIFTRTDVGAGEGVFALTPDGAGVALAKASPLCTLLMNNHGTTLSTIEHLMAALAGLSITNLYIDIDGPEVPILDGSALPWVELIDTAGRSEQAAPAAVWNIPLPVIQQSEGRVLEALPSGKNPSTGWRIEVHVHFPHPAIGQQSWQGVIDEATFRKEIAPARTFIEEDQLNAAKAAGMARGATLECGILFNSSGGVSNPEGLRFVNEPVRHKVLDALGDLYLGARRIGGTFHLTAPGHSANNALLRKIIEHNKLLNT